MPSTTQSLEQLRKLVKNDDLELTLRMIIAFARDGKNLPKDIYVTLIREAFEEHVIGQNLKPLNCPCAHDHINQKLAEQRTALWGQDKK